MSNLITRVFESKKELDKRLAKDAARILGDAVEAKGEATLVVSGGSTPLRFFSFLCEQEVQWSKVTVLLADERWVEPDSYESNELLVRKHLLVKAASSARFIPFKTSHDNPFDALPQLDGVLSMLGSFDLVILGMGADGHTASLFSDSGTIDQGLDMDSGRQCIGVNPFAAPHKRISMTLPRLLDSKQIIVHITGDEKKAVLEEARKKNNPLILPIAAVLNQDQTPVAVYWAE